MNFPDINIIVSHLCNVCKAGTLIWDECLVQSVSEPRAHHLDLVIIPLLHHVEDPEVVIDPLCDGVHVVPDKMNIALPQIYATSSHVNLLCLDSYYSCFS